ncbi:phosphatase PAP2 family protein [Cognatilysobacter bugurensis]|uniref:undecaprenyl-diphosphate phosphatase n=1 Tax=Cognatilysobacter bugurensis TaxID=543356 RepID=A0A918SU94_9GAMM|nr:phosphatase PAP2 family protein [Lysobacter bugurensis]GHA69519.1 phosphatase PAP2 family protein [Lysobacter bugurensis]
MKPVQWRRHLGRHDAGWCLRANRWCSRGRARPIFAVISRLGDGVAWYALMAMLVLFDGFAGVLASMHLALTGVVALALYRVLKRYTQRPRPFVFDARIRALVAPLDEFSFPSGHTLHAVAFSLVAIAHYPSLAWILVPFTAGIAASRVVLGLHYPTDVLAATVLGGSIAAASWWLWPLPVQ